jgi:hypothetical protein
MLLAPAVPWREGGVELQHNDEGHPAATDAD